MANSAFGATGAIAALPAGVMIDYAGTVAPAGWVMCDGAAVSRTVYASLFSAIGTAYGSGDGSTTFNLPDFRGRFVRYNDNMNTVAGAAGRDTGRVHGSTQADAIQGHKHTVSESAHSHARAASNGPGSSQIPQDQSAAVQYGAGRVADQAVTTGLTVQNPSTDGTNGTPRTAAETRPINLSCNIIIKY